MARRRNKIKRSSADGDGRVGAAAVAEESVDNGRSHVRNGRHEASVGDNRPVAVGEEPPVNPYARRVAELRQVMLACLTNEKIEEITHALIDQATMGNVSAAKLLFQYTLGKPVEGGHPDETNLDEWRILRDEAGIAAEIPQVAGRPDADYLLKVARTMRPVGRARYARTLGAALAGDASHISVGGG